MQTSGKQSGPPVDGNERRDDVLTSLERVWPGSMRLHVASGDCRRLEERRKVVSTASSPSVDKKRRKYLQHSKSGLVSTSQSRILSCPSRLLDVKVQENSIKSDYETLGTIRMLRKKNVRVSHWWWPCNSSFSMIVFFSKRQNEHETKEQIDVLGNDRDGIVDHRIGQAEVERRWSVFNKASGVKTRKCSINITKSQRTHYFVCRTN